MAEALPPSRRLELFVLLLAVSLFGVVEVAVAHNNLTQASTDPAEVRALNSMFQRWRISANQNQWNKSGEPCSGDAIYRDIDWENTEHNPFIKCDCTYESNTLCHVTQLKVYAMNVVGELPHELYTLTYLTHVHVGINALSGELPRELGMLSDMSFLGIESNNFSGPLPSELSSWRNLREFSYSLIVGWMVLELPARFLQALLI